MTFSAQSGLLLTLASSGRADAASNVARLLRMGVAANTADAQGFTALASAARTGDLAVCEQLLAHGASLSLPTRKSRNPPLFWAAMGGHVDVVRRLCEPAGNGAISDDIIGQRNVQSDTSLIYACQSGQAAAAGYLLDACPALLGEANDHGFTPLMFAAAGGHAETLNLILERISVAVRQPGRASEEVRTAALEFIDAKNNHGRCALHFAATSTSPPCVAALLAAGADWRVRDVHGCTPLGEAKKEGRTTSAKLLQRAWALAEEAAAQAERDRAMALEAALEKCAISIARVATSPRAEAKKGKKKRKGGGGGSGAEGGALAVVAVAAASEETAEAGRAGGGAMGPVAARWADEEDEEAALDRFLEASVGATQLNGAVESRAVPAVLAPRWADEEAMEEADEQVVAADVAEEADVEEEAEEEAEAAEEATTIGHGPPQPQPQSEVDRAAAADTAAGECAAWDVEGGWTTVVKPARRPKRPQLAPKSKRRTPPPPPPPQPPQTASAHASASASAAASATPAAAAAPDAPTAAASALPADVLAPRPCFSTVVASPPVTPPAAKPHAPAEPPECEPLPAADGRDGAAAGASPSLGGAGAEGGLVPETAAEVAAAEDSSDDDAIDEAIDEAAIDEAAIGWRRLRRRHPLLGALDIRICHLLGEGLDELSMAQIAELMEVRARHEEVGECTPFPAPAGVSPAAAADMMRACDGLMSRAALAGAAWAVLEARGVAATARAAPGAGGRRGAHAAGVRAAHPEA